MINRMENMQLTMHRVDTATVQVKQVVHAVKASFDRVLIVSVFLADCFMVLETGFATVYRMWTSCVAR